MKQIAKRTIQLIIVLFLMIIFISLGGAFLERFDFWQRFGLAIRQEQQVDVFTALLEQRNISQLETASLYTELIFPYDFLTYPFPENNREWGNLYNRVEGNFFSRNERDARIDALQPNEQENYRFYDRIKAIGIDMANSNPSEYIFRIKVTAKAGFDFTGVEWLIFSQEEQSVTINLPDPQILNLNILVDYIEPWPDVIIRPQEFGELISFLQPLIEQIIKEKYGLPEMADENGRRLIQKMIPGQNISIIFSSKK